jgi:hypothetical protein
MHFVPAVSAQALLSGLQACGINAAKIIAAIALALGFSERVK